MRAYFNKIRLRKDLDRIEILHVAKFTLLSAGVVLEHLNKSEYFYLLFIALVLTVFYHGYTRTLKGLFYSYWTFTLFTCLFLISKLFDDHIPGYGLYAISLCLLIYESYLVSSPIYYPLESWWEYDFRYRCDFKIIIKSKDKEYEGRLSDLRRKAGCVSTFADLKVGEKIEIITNEKDPIILKAEIMSKRLYSIGRPFSLGVRFSIENASSFELLRSYWKNRKINKKKLKLSKS